MYSVCLCKVKIQPSGKKFSTGAHLSPALVKGDCHLSLLVRALGDNKVVFAAPHVAAGLLPVFAEDGQDTALGRPSRVFIVFVFARRITSLSIMGTRLRPPPLPIFFSLKI